MAMITSGVAAATVSNGIEVSPLACAVSYVFSIFATASWSSHGQVVEYFGAATGMTPRAITLSTSPTGPTIATRSGLASSVVEPYGVGRVSG
jgi:hypothetical protein